MNFIDNLLSNISLGYVLIFSGVAAILTAIFFLIYQTGKAQRLNKNSSFLFETDKVEWAHRELEIAGYWMPVLKKSLMFWVGVCFLAAFLSLDVFYTMFIVGGTQGAILLFFFFLPDATSPFITLKTDYGSDGWFSDRPASTYIWITIAFATSVYLIYKTGPSMSLSSSLKANVEASNRVDLERTRDNATRQIARLQQEKSIQDAAKAVQDKRFAEQSRTGIGPRAKKAQENSAAIQIKISRIQAELKKYETAKNNAIRKLNDLASSNSLGASEGNLISGSVMTIILYGALIGMYAIFFQVADDLGVGLKQAHRRKWANIKRKTTESDRNIVKEGLTNYQLKMIGEYEQSEDEKKNEPFNKYEIKLSEQERKSDTMVAIAQIFNEKLEPKNGENVGFDDLYNIYSQLRPNKRVDRSQFFGMLQQLSRSRSKILRFGRNSVVQNWRVK